MKLQLSNKEKLNFFHNLATMLGAGIPILETVADLKEESKGSLLKVLKKLEDDIKEGKTVSKSLSVLNVLLIQ